MRGTPIVFAGLFAASVVASSAHAVLIEYSFSGRVSLIQNLGLAVAVGDPFSATLTYDPAYATGSGGPVQTDYSFPFSPQAYWLNVRVGSGAGYSGSGPNGLISILNDFGGARQDWFQTQSFGGTGFRGDAINGLPWTQTTLTLKDYQGTLYRDTLLPSQIASLNNFEEAFATMFFIIDPEGSSNGLINANIHSIQAVVSETGQASLTPERPTAVLAPGAAGGMVVTLPRDTSGLFIATYDQQAAGEVDFRGFNFFIPGDVFQTWDLHFDGAIRGDGLVDLVFTYDDTGMTMFEELTLDILHEVRPGRFVPLGGVVDIGRNTITASTPSFSSFYLGIAAVPEPGTWLLMSAGLLGLALRGRSRALVRRNTEARRRRQT